MSDHSTAPATEAPQSGLMAAYQRHHFLFRRLHSLSGVVPVGVFLIEHLITNASFLRGPEEFQHDIDFIWNLPGLLMLEIFGIWLPIAFHAGLGILYTNTRFNVKHYPYQDNWRYTFQRITGMAALLFIFLHLATTRWGWNFFGWHTPFDPAAASSSTVAALQFSPWVPWFYLVGTLATVYHFANGMWTAAITWGLTVTPRAQRRWGVVCLLLGLFLGILGTATIYTVSTSDIEEVRAIEREIQQKKAAAPGTTVHPESPDPAASEE